MTASSIIERVRGASELARALVRMAYQTGLLRDVRPAGVSTAVRLFAKGVSGPSAIWRIHAAGHPDRVALEFEGRRFSYREVDDRIDRIATGLRNRGMRKGDRAIVMLHNRPESLELASALSRLGAAGVAVSWRSTPQELVYLANHSGSRAIFFEPEQAANVTAALAQIPGVPPGGLITVGGVAEGFASLESVMASRAEGDLSAEEGSVIIYTSGTTGRPKGAVRGFGLGQAEGFLAFLAGTPFRTDERHLVVCPMYHSTGLGFGAMALLLGGTLVIAREFDPDDFLATIARERITSTAVVPTMLHRLMALPDAALRRHDLRSLRAIFCGGAQLPAALAERALEMLGPVLYNFYGSTETGLVTLATPDDLRASPGTIGRVIVGTTIRLLDSSGNDVPDGDVGELYARNSMLVEGYHADAEATRSSMRDGFFSVGDLARRDGAGRYHIVGRQRDMVISGGVNVYPAEVEAAIEAHPSVAQAAVVGVPDPEWGERLRAFVVLRASGVDANELRAFCRSTLSGAKVPREWVFVDALPANATGKILKRELREYAGDVVKL